MANKLWTLFKKGFWFEVIDLIITYIIAKIGISTFNLTPNTIIENLGLTILIYIIVKTIVSGYLIEYLNERIS